MKIQVTKEIKMSNSENPRCDFCQEKKQGFLGECVVQRWEEKNVLVPVPEGIRSEKVAIGEVKSLFFGGFKMRDYERKSTFCDYNYMKVIDKNGKESLTVNPLICEDCVLQLAKQIKK